MNRILIFLCIAVLMTGCSTKKKNEKFPADPPKVMSPATMSELEQGKRLFQDGYYKRAMQQLLPLAVDGNAEAQYAVGYMYYYGFGTTQDTASGDFWIRRSAEQNYKPALDALTIMVQEKNKHIKIKRAQQ